MLLTKPTHIQLASSPSPILGTVGVLATQLLMFLLLLYVCNNVTRPFGCHLQNSQFCDTHHCRSTAQRSIRDDDLKDQSESWQTCRMQRSNQGLTYDLSLLGSSVGTRNSPHEWLTGWTESPPIIYRLAVSGRPPFKTLLGLLAAALSNHLFVVQMMHHIKWIDVNSTIAGARSWRTASPHPPRSCHHPLLLIVDPDH